MNTGSFSVVTFREEHIMYVETTFSNSKGVIFVFNDTEALILDSERVTS